MEVTLYSPKNSFVQFAHVDDPPAEESCCSEPYCLPIINEDDWWFQFRILCPDQHTACEIAADPFSVQLLLLRGMDNDATTAPGNKLRNFTAQDDLHFTTAITGVNEVTFYWGNPLLAFDDYINCYECFQLALIVQGAGGSGKDATHFSNCFIRQCRECDFSIVQSWCEEDSYDFRFCQFEYAPNRARLPFYLEAPQPITDKSVYPRSDGSWFITKSVTKQEWSGIVDAIQKELHFRFAIALEHDEVIVETDQYKGGFRCSNNYTIDWPKIRKVCIGPATFKGNATPFDARNNNCAVCDEIDPYQCADTVPCSADVSASYELTTDLGGNPIIRVSWDNINGTPILGYSTNIGGSSSGIPTGAWGVESPNTTVDNPPGSGTFIHEFGYSLSFHGELAVRITSHCNATSTHETILIITIP